MVTAVKKKKAKAKKPAKKAAKAVAKKKPIAKKTVAKKAPAKKVVAKKAVATKKSAKKSATVKDVKKKIAVKKVVAKKTSVRKPVAKKPVKKSVAKKPTPAKIKIAKKGEATKSIDLVIVGEDELDAAIDTVVDEALEEAAEFGDIVEFADDDIEEADGDTAPSPQTSASGEGGMPEQMRDAALKVLDERQADDIVSVALAGRSSLADYVIIASGRTGRQVAALADYLRETFTQLGIKHVRVEGLGECNWALVDAGDVIVHLFRPEVRSYYDIDSIWSAKHPR